MSRFDRLSAALAAKGAANPDALAAWIGRKKYTAAGMAALAAKGRAANAAKQAVSGRSMCLRSFDFETRSSSDGRTLDGYVAVFRSVARIRDHSGDFDEEIHPGAFDKSLSRSLPVMQFDHGKDPRTGSVPIGVYDVFEPDNHGYRVRGRLFDNALVEPVRQAIAGGAIRGMSWRMMVGQGGDKWSRRNGVDKRDILAADVPEAGPVVFPAYDATSVSVRSILSNLDVDERQALIRELAEELRSYMDLSNLTGRPAQGAGGGDPDATAQERGASKPKHLRQALDEGALRIRGIK